MTKSSAFDQLRGYWKELNFYQRFEQIVAWLLSLVVALIIAIAVVRIGVKLLGDLTNGTNVFSFDAFKDWFGMILVVLIALEFNHSIVQISEGRRGLVQLRAVIVIALLALVRKIMVLDLEKMAPLFTVSLAALTLVLGVVYWLVLNADRRGLERKAQDQVVR